MERVDALSGIHVGRGFVGADEKGKSGNYIRELLELARLVRTRFSRVTNYIDLDPTNSWVVGEKSDANTLSARNKQQLAWQFTDDARSGNNHGPLITLSMGMTHAVENVDMITRATVHCKLTASDGGIARVSLTVTPDKDAVQHIDRHISIRQGCALGTALLLSGNDLLERFMAGDNYSGFNSKLEPEKYVSSLRAILQRGSTAATLVEQLKRDGGRAFSVEHASYSAVFPQVMAALGY